MTVYSSHTICKIGEPELKLGYYDQLGKTISVLHGRRLISVNVEDFVLPPLRL